MKQLALVFFAIVLISGVGKSQSIKAIPNGDFEQWDTVACLDLEAPWMTQNTVNLANFGSVEITKVKGVQGSAVHLQTFTFQGNIVPAAIQGMLPGTKNVTGLRGYFRSNLLSGDFVTLFLQTYTGGVLTSIKTFKLASTDNSFSLFSFDFNLTQPADSMLLRFVTEFSKTESWMELDELGFEGQDVPQIFNGGFDFWSQKDFGLPQDWQIQQYTTLPVGTTKSKDSHSGNFSAELTNGCAMLNYMTNNRSLIGTDSLTGFYRFLDTTGFQSEISMNYQDANVIGTLNAVFLDSSSSWKYFSFPVNFTRIYDTVMVSIMPNWAGADLSTYKLFLDDLEFASQRHYSVVQISENHLLKIDAFPDPAQNQLNIRFGTNAPPEFGLKIYNSEGRLIIDNHFKSGSSTVTIPIFQLSAGLYFYEVTANGSVVRNKFVKN